MPRDILLGLLLVGMLSLFGGEATGSNHARIGRVEIDGEVTLEFNHRRAPLEEVTNKIKGTINGSEEVSGEVLDFSRGIRGGENYINGETAKPLVKFLCGLNNVRVVNLHGNRIVDVTYFADLLRKSTLEYLIVSDNYVSLYGIRKLASVLGEGEESLLSKVIWVSQEKLTNTISIGMMSDSWIDAHRNYYRESSRQPF